MKKTLVVSLVSEQTIPNILAILHFKPDWLLFVSTEEMQKKKKVEAILNTLRQRDFSWEKDEVLIVDQDSISDCMDKLKHWIEKKVNFHTYETIVNITGGTKMMSIAAYEVFKACPCQIIYIPIPKNEFFIAHSPKGHMPSRKIDVRLNVVEYLTAYGINISEKTKQKVMALGKKARERFEKTDFIYKHYLELKPFLKTICSELRRLEKSSVNKIKKGKKIEFSFSFQSSLNDYLKKLLSDWDFEYNIENQKLKIHRLFDSDLYHYFIGGWLEEYVYNILYDLKPQGITDVQLNLQLISSQGTQNEFDVMFTYENALYFVECKSLDQEHDKEQDILYKVGALQTDFGLRVKSFLATQATNIFEQNGEIKDHLEKRAKQMRTIILPLVHIHDLKEKFMQEIFR